MRFGWIIVYRHCILWCQLRLRYIRVSISVIRFHYLRSASLAHPFTPSLCPLCMQNRMFTLNFPRHNVKLRMALNENKQKHQNSVSFLFMAFRYANETISNRDKDIVYCCDCCGFKNSSGKSWIFLCRRNRLFTLNDHNKHSVFKQRFSPPIMCHLM